MIYHLENCEMAQQVLDQISRFSFRALAAVLDKAIARVYNILFFSSAFLRFLRSLVSLRYSTHSKYVVTKFKT